MLAISLKTCYDTYISLGLNIHLSLPKRNWTAWWPYVGTSSWPSLPDMIALVKVAMHVESIHTHFVYDHAPIPISDY